ncbi:MAG TPA: hypothetical protein DCS42_00780 [Nitrospiraceae bacterium]|nr:hypothetical protein [Nitrospiraceae bacterium]
MRNRKIASGAAGAVLLAVLLILLMTPIVSNVWLLAIDPLFVIPRQSSIFSFEPTVLNPGSGDWWLYGEDGEHYYHFTGERPCPVVSYPQKLASECPGFEPLNYATWCLGRGRDALIK